MGRIRIKLTMKIHQNVSKRKYPSSTVISTTSTVFKAEHQKELKTGENIF